MARTPIINGPKLQAALRQLCKENVWNVRNLAQEADIKYELIRRCYSTGAGLSIENFKKLCLNLDLNESDYYLFSPKVAAGVSEPQLCFCPNGDCWSARPVRSGLSVRLLPQPHRYLPSLSPKCSVCGTKLLTACKCDQPFTPTLHGQCPKCEKVWVQMPPHLEVRLEESDNNIEKLDSIVASELESRTRYWQAAEHIAKTFLAQER